MSEPVSKINNIFLFNEIKTFVGALAELFSEEYHSLALYDRLLQKTQPTHTDAVSKHISAFRKFCIENTQSILNSDFKFNSIIEYSKKVFIDLTSIASGTDDETRNVIRTHLLTMIVLFDPSCESAKEQLRSQTKHVSETSSENYPIFKFDTESSEGKFLNNILGKVTQIVQPTSSGPAISNPSEVFAKIMSSGAIDELVSGMPAQMEEGMDIGKLFGMVQHTIKDIAKDSPQNDPQLNQLMGMMSMISGAIPK